MREEDQVTFQSLSENVGQFELRDKTFLIPEMSRIGCHLLAATFRSFGVKSIVMETYEGLDLGKEFTSGKECYPCQVTMGDILYFIKREKERLGDEFDPERYVYFMPEATGPCRFGMYNKYQRIVLDSIPELQKLKIGSLTTGNAYSLRGMFDKRRARRLRKAAYLSVIVGDVLDRLLWRIRPYEREPGMAEEFIERSMETLSRVFERYGADMEFDRIIEELDHVLVEGKGVINPNIPPKPLIGIVGEIYLRTHRQSNQQIAQMLEKYGAEVVISSMTEWIDFTAYENARTARKRLLLNLRQFRMNPVKRYLKDVITYGGELFYQQKKQHQVYKRVNRVIGLPEIHQVGHLENVLTDAALFSFDVGTEACLSIAGLMEFARDGCNGVVNVYPFTCMPGTITSAIMKPFMNRMRIPYLDAVYDGTYQPEREATIRTFMYQARQHFERNRRRS